LIWSTIDFMRRLDVDYLSDRHIHIRVTVHEYELLTAFCKAAGRTQSDVLRECVRALEPRLEAFKKTKRTK
jgi:hypothetical protein